MLSKDINFRNKFLLKEKQGNDNVFRNIYDFLLTGYYLSRLFMAVER